MRYLLNHTEMQNCDSATITQMKMPAPVLMERAALAVFHTARERYPEASRVLALCGSGNNGGDGFATARLLLLAGIRADVLFVGKHAHMTEQTKLEAEIFVNYGGVILEEDVNLSSYDLIIDALFGIGLSRVVSGRYADLINAVNRLDTPVLSVDIPSGVSADDGQILHTAIKADATVTFAFEKLGHALYPGASQCGDLYIRDVGITDLGLAEKTSIFPQLNQNQEKERGPVYTLEASDLPASLPKRFPEANKSSYGKLLLIAGDEGMAGAAILACKAALRAGCGMAAILSAAANRQILQTTLPEALFGAWEDGLSRWLSWADAIAIGPGLGQSHKALSLLRELLESWHGPLVLDADALNLISREHLPLERPGLPPMVLTPHPGEMQRLLKAKEADSSGEAIPIKNILAAPIPIAQDFAERNSVVLVLKGPRTVVTDGDETMLNLYGNDGMAAAGSGDCLTGIIGSLLAQGCEPFTGASDGVVLHALAGDLAAEKVGRRSLLAGDIADCLPELFQRLEHPEKSF